MSNISQKAWIDPEGKVNVGEDVLISNDVKIFLHTHKENEYLWSKEMERNRTSTELTIGDNVFIGESSIILPQCKSIGEHSIIGAGSVVTKDIPADEVWAGNPARKIRSRKFEGRKDILA